MFSQKVKISWCLA